MDKRLYKVREILEGEYKPGEDVAVKGWISEINKDNWTMIIRDGTGLIRVSFNHPKYTEPFPEAGRESVVLIQGAVNPKEKPPLINASYHDLLKPSVDYPSPEEISLPKNRHLRIRYPEMRAKIKIWNTAEDAIRVYLKERGFEKIPTPSITTMAAENPFTLFPITYFDYYAHLAQTGKPYLDAAVPQFENVWSFVPTFRKEQIKSRRHLSEFRTVEILQANSSYKDMMRLTEDLFLKTIRTVADERPKELEILERDSSVLKRDIQVPPDEPLFMELTYNEAMASLKKAYKKQKKEGFEMESGRRFTQAEEDMLCDVTGAPFFVRDFPSRIRSFYIEPHPKNPELSKSFDLIAPISGELATGGQMITDYELLKERITEHGFLRPYYNWFLDLRKFGEVETSFVGIGFERLLMHITGSENITDVSPFPRTYGENPIP